MIGFQKSDSRKQSFSWPVGLGFSTLLLIGGLVWKSGFYDLQNSANTSAPQQTGEHTTLVSFDTPVLGSAGQTPAQQRPAPFGFRPTTQSKTETRVNSQSFVQPANHWTPVPQSTTPQANNLVFGSKTRTAEFNEDENESGQLIARTSFQQEAAQQYSVEMEPYPLPVESTQNQQVQVQNQFATNQYATNPYAANNCDPYCQPIFSSHKHITAVDGRRRNPNREPRWGDADLLPWESLAYGEYIGPVRTPHVQEYRVRVGDQLDFTFRQTREITQQPYRLGVGDEISINSGGDYNEYNDEKIVVLHDGTVQLRGIGSVVAANKTLERLQDEINELYMQVATEVSPKMIIKVIKPETQLNDLIRTVDATAGQGGQFRTLTVSPDGTVQLPALGSVPAIGLSLDELGAEANARYAMLVQGLEVTPSLRASAPTFAYVLGEVNNPGQIQLNGPTTVMQLISQAGGWRTGANLREIVVFRRDENWRLVATKLDLAAPLFGNAPHPSDEMWIRNNDIILLPKSPGQRVVDFIDIYFQRGLYGVFPSQGFSVNFDGVSSL